MSFPIVTILIAIVSMLGYHLTARPKLAETYRLMMFAALLATMLALSGYKITF